MSNQSIAAVPLCALSTPSIAEAALEECQRGRKVIILHGLLEDPESGQIYCDCKSGISCRSAGKHPRGGKGWRGRATSNAHAVKSWWEKSPNSNLGLPTGRGFGVAIDFDLDESSTTKLARLEAEFGPLPETLSVFTGSGGLHKIFDYPDGYEIGNSKFPVLDDYTKIDIRGNGGLVVAPPSRHYSGGRYEWATPRDHPLAPLPSFLLEDLELAPDAVILPQSTDKWTKVAVESECNRVRAAGEGSRNSTLMKAAYKVGQIVAGGSIDRDVAMMRLEEAALQTGLGADEIRDCIHRAFHDSESHPRRCDPFSGREDALGHVYAMKDALFAYPFPGGHQGARMRICMDALVRLAINRGGPQFTAAVTSVAKAAGSSRSRMIKALRECQEAELIKLISPGTAGRGTVWKLTVPITGKMSGQNHATSSNESNAPTILTEGSVSNNLHHPPIAAVAPTEAHRESNTHLNDQQVLHSQTDEDAVLIPLGVSIGVCNTTPSPTHDLFMGPVRSRSVRSLDRDTGEIIDQRAKGLGRTAWTIYEWLLRNVGWFSRGQVARAIGMSTSTVGRTVKAMSPTLIEIGDLGVRAIAVDVEVLDAMAEERNLSGVYGEMVNRYEAMRPDLPFEVTYDSSSRTSANREGFVLRPKFAKGWLGVSEYGEDPEIDEPTYDLNFDWRSAS